MSPLAALGRKATGERRARIQRSPQFRDGVFVNPVPTAMMTPGGMWESLRHQLLGKENRVPPAPLPVVRLVQSDYDAPPESGLRVAWLGHSSVLVEIDGFRVLIDPVFSRRASPSQLVGPLRFHPPPITVAGLPELDAVIITHDHYDHLDYLVVREMVRRGSADRTQWITALGVGAHLEYWGVQPARVTELDWGDSARVGALTVTAQPARHFSGRGLERFQTLWASWVIAGPKHRVFHSGDTGYFDALADIGARFGPFDVGMIKMGSYGETWPDIHLNPEEAVRVHRMTRGQILLPIHWGTFNLAFHAWHEPVERLLMAGSEAGATVVTPKPGQRFEPARLPAFDPWWRSMAGSR